MKLFNVFVFGLLLFCCYGCSKFLEAKPDGSLAIPNSLADLRALLDYEDRMIMGYPEAGDVASDYYYLNEADWMGRSIDARNIYLWDKDAQNGSDWNLSYERIFISNVVLDEVDNAKLGNLKEVDRNTIKGSAYFFRGFSYLQLAQIFAPYYSINMDDSPYGLPLKLKSDINEEIKRSSLKQTYDQIIDDLSKAVELLPDQVSIVTKPSRSAAHTALARLYLIIGDYEKSLYHADAVLQIQHSLMDYNELDSMATFPFKLLNKEVIFNGVISTSYIVHSQARAFVNPDLVVLYHSDDLRRTMFFRKESNDLYRFKGSYEANNISIFGGLALDELYLISAECMTRLHDEDNARSRLNELLVNRWRKGKFISIGDELSGEELLRRILEEREKELCFRGGIRWSDLRRLNADPRFAKTLTRTIQNTVYKLEPNDLRYTFLIPIKVMNTSDLEQNSRK